MSYKLHAMNSKLHMDVPVKDFRGEIHILKAGDTISYLDFTKEDYCLVFNEEIGVIRIPWEFALLIIEKPLPQN